MVQTATNDTEPNSARSEISVSSQGLALDTTEASFGSLRSSADVRDDPAELRRRVREDGYLYLPGFFPAEEIRAVRARFVHDLQAQGLLDPVHPADAAVSRPGTRGWLSRDAVQGNAGLRDVVFSRRLLDFYTSLFGGEARAYDHIWTRVIPPGRGTAPHCDLVYMSRGTPDVMTAWIPYGDVSLALGGLMLLEKSHLQTERIRRYLETDVDAYCTNRERNRHHDGILSRNPVSLREKLGGRWLTTEFRMGDLLTFGMTTVHASLDNRTQAYRMSSDTRYQLASEPIDARWVGPDTEENAPKNRLGRVC